MALLSLRQEVLKGIGDGTTNQLLLRDCWITLLLLKILLI